MNQYVLHKPSSALFVCDEIRTAVVCPKPRRFGLRNDPVRSLRWHLGHQGELSDSKDALDTILTKGVEQFSFSETGGQHPFFNGSPPARVANPLIRDDRFGSEKLMTPVSPLSPVTSSSSSSRSGGGGGGRVGAIFVSKPTVRVEGFDCMDRDSRNRGISSRAWGT